MCTFAGKTASSVAMLKRLPRAARARMQHSEAAGDLRDAARLHERASGRQPVGHDRLVRARDHEVHDPGEDEERAEQAGAAHRAEPIRRPRARRRACLRCAWCCFALARRLLEAAVGRVGRRGRGRASAAASRSRSRSSASSRLRAWLRASCATAVTRGPARSITRAFCASLSTARARRRRRPPPRARRSRSRAGRRGRTSGSCAARTSSSGSATPRAISSGSSMAANDGVYGRPRRSPDPKEARWPSSCTAAPSCGSEARIPAGESRRRSTTPGIDYEVVKHPPRRGKRDGARGEDRPAQAAGDRVRGRHDAARGVEGPRGENPRRPASSGPARRLLSRAPRACAPRASAQLRHERRVDRVRPCPASRGRAGRRRRRAAARAPACAKSTGITGSAAPWPSATGKPVAPAQHRLEAGNLGEEAAEREDPRGRGTVRTRARARTTSPRPARSRRARCAPTARRAPPAARRATPPAAHSVAAKVSSSGKPTRRTTYQCAPGWPGNASGPRGVIATSRRSGSSASASGSRSCSSVPRPCSSTSAPSDAPPARARGGQQVDRGGGHRR